jgi:hypothetical protein
MSATPHSSAKDLIWCHPLHVAKEILTSRECRLSILRKTAKPIARCFRRLMFGRPRVPSFRLAIFFHKGTEKDIVVQPGEFCFAELLEACLSIFARLLGEPRKGLF